jgi:hypothetical protein
MIAARPIRFVINSITYPFYLFGRFAMPIHARLCGVKVIHVGKCTIMAPEKQMQIILAGVQFLQTVDLEMFRQLTAEYKFIFWYHPKHYLDYRDIFSITDKFLLWGKEGVAICFVQSILGFTLMELPSSKASIVDHRTALATRCDAKKRLASWISKHPFPAELVSHYQNIAIEAEKSVSST